MSKCLNEVGFVFNKAKTLIKKDKQSRYSKYNCQECNWIRRFGSSDKIIPGTVSPCKKCTDNSQYKILIFEVKKENFVSSSLEISTGIENAWENFKKEITYQKNGNFVISVTKCNKAHSFYANLIKSKKCPCCEKVLLYFKYNIIPLLNCYQQGINPENTFQYDNFIPGQCTYPPPSSSSYGLWVNSNTPGQNVNVNLSNPYYIIGANSTSNITYDIKSGEYDNVRFFNSSVYTYSPYINTTCV